MKSELAPFPFLLHAAVLNVQKWSVHIISKKEMFVLSKYKMFPILKITLFLPVVNAEM